MIYNTKQNGIVRILTLRIGKKYKAICLDFDIIEEAQSKKEVERQINEAIAGYVINIQKNDLSDDLLNRHADKKYWDIYNAYIKFIHENGKTQKMDKNIKNSEITTTSIEEILRSSNIYLA